LPDGASRILDSAHKPLCTRRRQQRTHALQKNARSFRLNRLASRRVSDTLHRSGISNVTVTQLELARSITPIVSVQNMYNLRDQTSSDILAACERFGFSALVPVGR
jgi:aryl-alcohol dehydrogenase-like predicted oxidoreductase